MAKVAFEEDLILARPARDFTDCVVCRVVVVIARGFVVDVKDGSVRDVIDARPYGMKAGGQQRWRELTVFAAKSTNSAEDIGADYKA